MSTKTSNNTTNTEINQNQLVIGYLRRNSRRNLTSEQICEGVNEVIKTMTKGKNKPKVQLTTTQVSKCLNRFSEREMVKRIDDGKGRLSNGRKCLRWGYVKP